jgi:hypothetical protein
MAALKSDGVTKRMTDRDHRIMEYKAGLRWLIQERHSINDRIEELQRMLSVVYDVELEREGLGNG